MYANSITITPGTVTLDMNNNMLLVHALNKSSFTDLQRSGMIKKLSRQKQLEAENDIRYKRSKV